VKAAFTPYKQKLEAIMKAIQEYGSALALEASLAAEISELSPPKRKPKWRELGDILYILQCC
jgi:histidinol phosphatase-like PHP family hydrolase